MARSLASVLCSAHVKNAQSFSCLYPEVKDEQQDYKEAEAGNSESEDSPIMK